MTHAPAAGVGPVRADFSATEVKTHDAGNVPLVSVIVPAYNCESYLGEALDSLVGQTIRDIEIIVVDDGSTDRTAGVAAAYAARDRRIRVINRESPSGRPASARNEGLRAARGQYIALLDADDIAMPNRLCSAVGAMERTGARFTFADYRRWYDETGEIDAVGMLESSGFVRDASAYLEQLSETVYICDPKFSAFLLTFTAVHTPTVVFHRGLLALEKTWFDESLVCFEDVDLWFRWAEHTRFAFVNEVHALYRRHPGSITAGRRIQTVMDGVAVRQKHLERLRPRLSTREAGAAEANIAGLLSDVGYLRWCSGEKKPAREAYWASWRVRHTRTAITGWVKALLPRERAVSALATFRRRLGVR